jgi:hypothetical protein
MDLKEKIAREVENAKYANHNCTGIAERILSLFRDSENLPIDFIKWYSGMDKEKILKAYERWIKESGTTIE